MKGNLKAACSSLSDKSYGKGHNSIFLEGVSDINIRVAVISTRFYYWFLFFAAATVEPSNINEVYSGSLVFFFPIFDWMVNSLKWEKKELFVFFFSGADKWVWRSGFQLTALSNKSRGAHTGTANQRICMAEQHQPQRLHWERTAASLTCKKSSRISYSPSADTRFRQLWKRVYTVMTENKKLFHSAAARGSSRRRICKRWKMMWR